MNRTFLLRSAAAAALTLAAAASHAGTMTLSSWTWGNGNTVNVSNPAYNGSAGGFSGTLSGFGAFDGAINTYCVEITEHFSFGVGYSDYSIVNAASYFNATKLATLKGLIGNVFGSNLFASTAAGFRDDQSTALQLAIWNVVYDTDYTLNASSGSVFNDASAYRNGAPASYIGANDLLSAAAAGSPGSGNFDLYVLKSVGNPGHQDQLIWIPHAVPEPTSLALVALALGAVGWAKRRRA